MKKTNTYTITKTAVFAALIFILTQFVKVPLPFGYANMGDCIVIMSGWIIGGFYGCAAAAIGSVLADILSGYVIYAPATFVIKTIMAFIAYIGYKAAKKMVGIKKQVIHILSAIVAECFMVAGYFLYEVILYGIAGAILSLSGNILQGVFSIVASSVLFHTLFSKFSKS